MAKLESKEKERLLEGIRSIKEKLALRCVDVSLSLDSGVIVNAFEENADDMNVLKRIERIIDDYDNGL